MAELLLLNPRKRRTRKARKTPAKRRRNPIAAVARQRPRRRNPIAAVAGRRTRRRNPIALRKASRRSGGRRRRNPIGGGLSVKGITRTLMDAAIMGAGAVGVDMAYAQINRMLPATMQPQPGRLGVGDAVKAVITAALGALRTGPPRALPAKRPWGR